MGQPNPTQTVTNPRIAKLIELETAGRIKPQHQTELDTYRAQGLAPKKTSGNTLTEYQGKSTGFYERAVGANKDFEGAGEGGSPVGVMGDTARAVLPANVVNSFTSSDRQKAQQAKEDFIRASLRYESGAAIGQTEFDGQDKIFFPQTGDSEDVIKQKAEARQRVIESLKVAAGPGVTNAPKNDGGAPRPPTNEEDRKKQEMLGTLVPTDVANKIEQAQLSDEQATAYDAFMKANPQATADQLRDFAKSMGLGNLENAEDIIKARDQGGGFVPGKAGVVRPPDISDVRGKGDMAEGADAAVRGAADTLSLGFADEISAAGKTVFGDGTMKDNLARERAIDAYDAEYSPWLRGGGQLAGGLLFPIGRGATTPGELAKIGGITGAGYGVGSGDDMESRLTGGALGGASGAALGFGAGKLFERLGRGGRGPNGGGDLARDVAEGAADQGLDALPTDGRGVRDAASDLRIPVLPADVGGPSVRRITAGAVQTPFGSGPIVAAAKKAQDAAKGVRDRVATAVTDVADDYGAGRAAQRGLTSWIKNSDTRASRLYDAISVPKEQQAVTSNTLKALEEVTQGMDSNSELSSIWTGHPRLARTLDALRRPEVRQVSDATGFPFWEKAVTKNGKTDWVRLTQREVDDGAAEGGGVSWEDMKRLRSIIGNIIGKPSLTSEGPEIDAMRRVYAGLSEDMRATAEKAGPKALREFERANGFWSGRNSRIENVVKPILGDDNGDGQAAFNKIQNWAKDKGESVRIAQMVRSLPKDETETIAATVISKLGQASAGRQGAAGGTFSLSDFLTHWNRLDARAKSSLFTEGQRASLDKLAKVAEGTRQAQQFANSSQTAGALGANATTGGLASAAGLLFTGHPILATVAATPAAGQYLTGRLMASPRFVNWLVRMPKERTGAISYIKGAERAFAKDGAISYEIGQFQQRMLSAMNDNAPRTGSVAASPDERPQEKDRRQ